MEGAGREILPLTWASWRGPVGLSQPRALGSAELSGPARPAPQNCPGRGSSRPACRRPWEHRHSPPDRGLCPLIGSRVGARCPPTSLPSPGEAGWLSAGSWAVFPPPLPFSQKRHFQGLVLRSCPQGDMGSAPGRCHHGPHPRTGAGDPRAHPQEVSWAVRASVCSSVPPGGVGLLPGRGSRTGRLSVQAGVMQVSSSASTSSACRSDQPPGVDSAGTLHPHLRAHELGELQATTAHLRQARLLGLLARNHDRVDPPVPTCPPPLAAP